MIQIGDTLCSIEIFVEKFVCDLSACKGACCVEGDGGAPLSIEEAQKLQDILPDIWEYLDPKGQQVLKEKGAYIKAADGDLETPLLKGAECAYLIYDENNIAKCGIEAAHKAGATDFKKPVSCHLYPIRESEISIGLALNYHRWGICSPACSLGEELKVPVFKFLKDALIRKHGEDWYEEAELVYDLLKKEGRVQ